MLLSVRHDPRQVTRTHLTPQSLARGLMCARVVPVSFGICCGMFNQNGRQSLKITFVIYFAEAVELESVCFLI